MTRPAPALVVLGLGTLLSHGFGLSLVPAMLPRIADDLGVGYGVLGTVTAAGLVVYSVGALGAARVIERLPSRALLAGTYVVCSAGLLAAAAATSPAWLTAAVMLLGVTAPVSWAVTLHVAGATVPAGARGAVMAGAASGAALGVLLNGVFVQTTADLHSWRVALLIAAAIGLLPTLGVPATFRRPVARPRRAAGASGRGGYRLIAASQTGRLVVGAAAIAGAVGFPFSVFLTATAIDELGVGAWRAGLLWWLIGGVGTVAGPLIGRYGDRASPLRALTAGALAFAGGLVLLAVSWNYAGLVAAAFGLAVLYYPIWGLVGLVANHRFEPALAMRAISLGLIGASAVGAVANAAAGAWIDASASFRGPVIVMAAAMGVAGVWHLAVIRRGGLEAMPSEPAR